MAGVVALKRVQKENIVTICSECGNAIEDKEEYFALNIHRERYSLDGVNVLSAMNLCIWCPKCWNSMMLYVKAATVKDFVGAIDASEK